MPERLSPNIEPSNEEMAELREKNKEKKEGILNGIKFTKKQSSDGKIIYRSSEPGRKLVVLDADSEFEPDENASYEVEILQDTEPDDPNKGKYMVRIISEDGVPVEARVAEKNKPIRSVEIDAEAGKIYILDSEMDILPKRDSDSPDPKKFKYFTLDDETLGVLEKVANGDVRREPTLLEGETSTSKTSTIELAAMLKGVGRLRLNLNGQTDTSELIGKFIPNDGQLQIRFEDALKNPNLLSPVSLRILQEANKDGRALSLIESQRIAQLEGMKVPDWRWKDGVDVQAKTEGKWLILDEINLAEPQILERLNSQLEKHPSITLSENGGKTIRELSPEEMELHRAGKLPDVIPLHPNFRIFATMNPAEYSGRQPMSPAFKDRWTNYKFVQPPSEKSYSAMMKKMVYGEQPAVTIRGVQYEGEMGPSSMKTLESIPNFGGFIAKMAKFQVTLEGLARKREIGKNKKEKYIFTRRGLMEFMEWIETATILDRKTKKKRTIQDAPKEIILRGIQNYYLDKISDPDDLKKVMDQLDAIGISENNWTHTFEDTGNKKLKNGGGKGVAGEKGGEKKEVFGRDPEPFLREVFTEEGWLGKWDDWVMEMSVDGKYVEMISSPPEAEKFIDKRDWVRPLGSEVTLRGIPALLEKIKGKKVISIDFGRRWHLEVVGGEKKEDDPVLDFSYDDILDEAEEGEKKEAEPVGREPEPFLREVSAGYGWTDKWDIWKMNISNDGKYIHMSNASPSTKKFIDKKESVAFAGKDAVSLKGIPALLEKIKGKKVISIDSGGKWFLEVVGGVAEGKAERPGAETPDDDILDEAEEGEKKEAEPVGHDPEPFLRKVFKEEGMLDKWDKCNILLSLDGKYVFVSERLPETRFIDKSEVIPAPGMEGAFTIFGIPRFLDKIKGKKVISINSGGSWYLEVVD